MTNQDDTNTLIIIEDEYAHAELLKIYLTDNSNRWNILTVTSLGEYNNLLKSTTPSIVLADINLPDGSSLSLLEKKNEFPILIMTSHADDEMAQNALKSGAADFILKSPETFKKMQLIISGALEKWKSIKM
ncbi:MAG TPA: response regulator [Bacteroidales bacterium]|nr:response regulator [Bacteroidales bacterium]